MPNLKRAMMGAAGGVSAGYYLFSWGRNAGTYHAGQVGDGTVIPRSSPVQIGDAVWAAKGGSGYRHKVAIQTDGTLWAWGGNNMGQLGDGTVVNRSSPVQVGTASNWVLAAPGYAHTGAIDEDGKLWIWGAGVSGALGLGNTISVSIPTQVGSLTTWSRVACLREATNSVKTDGTFWSWGKTKDGSSGKGNTTYYSSPTQLGSETDWTLPMASENYQQGGIRAGKLFLWGKNNNGQLGQGNIVDTDSPVQVGTATDWKTLTGVTGNTVIAVKTGGTIWSWGVNYYGQLGLGDVASRSSPVQIGSLTDWSAVDGGHGGSTQAVKSDYTAWTWGGAYKGRTGQGNTIRLSSPVQLGTDTDWRDWQQASGSGEPLMMKG